MTPDRWQQVKGIFDQAIACEPAGRDAFVRAACAGDADLYGEVISLVGSYNTAGSFFEKPVVQGRPAADPMVGRIFGVYRIVREIGRGGMGSVYLAVRTDDQFQRRVALKAIKPELADEHTLRRFQNERQMLAVLDHPNIIRLLDGGQSDDGFPYLVMDYVEGQPIDEYCGSHKLTIPERLQLFRTVCAAVHYAHQNLVVHRDLKPANILIAPDGVPKLLDFGIAKLLRPEFSGQALGLTRTRLQPMTPKYASPEQVLGHPITTASDIYALGVILYELLTGHHPFERESHTELELERAIADLEPEKPSIAVTHTDGATEAMLKQFREGRPEDLSRMLTGDLDCIVLMAMRKEPQRRYPSAEHLAEDVRRHLENLPVVARKGTARYRLGKFVRRHKMGVAAGFLVAASLVTGTLVAYRAELHTRSMFQDLLEFNDFFVNDLDNMLRKDGATKVRQAALTKSLPSLDKLARESSGDSRLQLRLINTYIKMGDVQGNPFVPNLGEAKAAEQSYRKALEMADTLRRAHPADPDSKLQVARSHLKLGDVLANRKDRIVEYRKALDIYESLPEDMARTGIMHAWDKTAAAQEVLGDAAGAVESIRRRLRDAQKLQPERKREAAVKMYELQIARLSALSGDTAGAEDVMLSVIAYYQRGANTRNVAQAFRVLADVQKREGKIPAALENIRQSLKITGDRLADDPNNQQNQIDYVQGKALLIDLLPAASERDKAEKRRETAQSLRYVKALLDQPDTSEYLIDRYVWLLVTTPFPELQDHNAALRNARQLVSMMQGTDPEALDLLALACHQSGDDAAAVSNERKALDLLPSGTRRSELRTTLETNLQKFQASLARRN